VFVVGSFVQACCWRVPRLPRAGETLEATGVSVEAGGKGLNVAIGLSRLGARVDALIGCGADVAGDALMALLLRERMDTTHIYRLAGPSAWGAGLIAPDGENAIAVCAGANLLLSEEHVSRSAKALAEAQLVYGQFETALPAVTAAFRQACALGIATVLSPSPWQLPPDELRHSTHTVIVNEVEALALLGRDESLADDAVDCTREVRAQIQPFWNEWAAAQRLIVTLGARGCLAFERPTSAQAHLESWHASAYPVETVDTVGAGDAFASGYCAALLAGCDLATALTWGNACGAHLASRCGVLEALPDDVTLERLLKESGPPCVTRWTEGGVPPLHTGQSL
jgi:ribokinase